MMLLMLVGSVDFGRGYYAAMEVSSAANAGACYGVQQPSDSNGMKNAAVADAPDIVSLSAVPVTGCECSDGSSASVGCTSIPTCSANVVNYVQLSTSATYNTLLNYPGLPSSITLHGFARMRTNY